MTDGAVDQSQVAGNTLDLSRRLIRVLGAQPAHVSDPEGTASAARLLYDRLRRLDPTVEWFDSDQRSPLVVAGRGPQLLICYLDDADPFAANHRGLPPSFSRGSVSSPGIVRKAAVIATVSRYIMDRGDGRWTLVIETDRHSGSQSLKQWLHESGRSVAVAMWEAADLPIGRPAVVRGATGRLHVTISVSLDHSRAESPYGGVIPDLGHIVSMAIADLMTKDHEIRLEGFYDDILTPNDEEMTAVSDLGAGISEWLGRVAPTAVNLPGRHLAMGVFLAPSLVVREITIDGPAPYLPTQALVRLEVQIAPGQSPAGILDALSDHFRDRLPSVQIQTDLLQAPVSSAFDGDALREEFDLVLPVAPGISPASLLADARIPTIGFISIGRNPRAASAEISLEQIVAGSEHIRTLGNFARKAIEQADK